MKRLIVFITVIISSFSLLAQDKGVVTEHYKVLGNCKSCKKRIEEAAFIKGVKRVEWDKHSKDLTLTYDASKTSADAVLKSIAKAGHESEKVKVAAEDPAYKKLPKCCAYKDTECND
ncbi:MAG TPA: heavy-metal-associated domain-containing protein [Flavipsychrobacter sp.]|nr:heavy-metal-associated domain-containing protein [Flavipsychrobacter sp.]